MRTSSTKAKRLDLDYVMKSYSFSNDTH